MATVGNPIIDFFIWIFLYGVYIIPPGAAFAVAYMIRIWSFPLITRNPHELVIMVNAGKVKIHKVKDNSRPLFTTKKGLYFFAESLPVTIQHKLTIKTHKPLLFKKTQMPELEQTNEQQLVKLSFAENRILLYSQDINQPLTDLTMMKTKIQNILTHYVPTKAVGSHAVQIPASLKWVFWRNWQLEVRSDSTIVLQPVRERQPLRVNFFIRMGIVFPSKQQQAIKEASTSAAASEKTMQSGDGLLSIQKITQSLGDIERTSNMSAAFYLDIVKKLRKLHSRKWMMQLTGQFDARLIFIVVGALAAIVLVLFMLQPNMSMLPPAPPGVKFP